MGEQEVASEAFAEIPAAPDPVVDEEQEFNPLLFVVFLVVILAVTVQNLWLRRKAEGKPFLSRRSR